MDKKMQTLMRLVRNNANILPEGKVITENTKLIEELGYDSVSLIQLIVDIEDEFGICLSNDDLLADKLDTPASLYELIEKILQNCFEICYVQSLPRNSRGKIVYEEFL